MRSYFSHAARLSAALALLSIASASTTRAQATQASVTNAAPENAFFEFQVEKPVSSRPGNPRPRYPMDDNARTTGGVVTAQFVVDTTGRVDITSFTVINASNKSFIQSVKDVLPSMHYFPAETGGRKVRQLVEQDFRFAPAP